MTLYEWTERWMENYVRPKVRPSTYAAKGYVLQNQIYPKLGNMTLNELTEARIENFLDERKRCGGSRPECPDYPGLSDITMRHIHRLLKECLDRAVEAGLMTSNPARAFHYDTRRKVKATVLSDNEIDAYLDSAEKLGYLPMFALMLTAGLRQRELITLKWSNFDEKHRVLTVSDGRSLVKGKLVEYGGGTHEVALPPETAALLRQEHEKHTSAELLFIHPGTRKPYLPTMLRLIHQRILDKAGLEPCRFEDLRHTATVRMLDKDGDVKAMSAQLGHSCAAMTKLLYADYLPVKNENAQAAEAKETTNAELQKAADTLGAMLRF